MPLWRFSPCSCWGVFRFSVRGGVFIPLNQFPNFAYLTEWIFFIILSRCAARCSSVHSLFALYGLCPSRYGYNVQRSTVQSFTSLELPQRRSRHFARMALMGDNFFSSMVFTSFLCLPPSRPQKGGAVARAYIFLQAAGWPFHSQQGEAHGRQGPFS